MKINKVAILGECMVELRSKRDGLYERAFGGDTLNTAVYLSRLTKNSGITTSYFTGLGMDSFSVDMIKAWNAEGIDTTYVQQCKYKVPGLYAITTDDNGERSFSYWRSDSAAKYWIRNVMLYDLIHALAEHDLIYLSGISLAILPRDCMFKLFEALKACKKKGVTIAFDNNYRPALWDLKSTIQQAYETIMELADIAFLTFDDEQMLYGDIDEQQSIERAEKLGVKEIVIKRGGDACYVVVDGEITEVAPEPVKNIVDTTAAGDSFSAGYLAKRLQGGSVKESALAGHKVAGTVIQHSGAIIEQIHMPKI